MTCFLMWAPVEKQDVKELRDEVTIMLRRAKPPKSNISREEKKALKELRKDQDRMGTYSRQGCGFWWSWSERSIRKK